MRTRILVICCAAATLFVLIAIPPVHQSEQYHCFFDHRTFCGIPNFWNVVSNAAFLWAAWVLWSAQPSRERWQRRAYGVLVAGVALTAFGSAFYHWHPDTGSLFWDRLPMTLVFMSLTALIVGERVHGNAGRRLLIPLLVAGAASVVYWRASGDLRLYGLIQFLPMLAIPAMLLLYPSQHSNTRALWAMVGLYLVAKIAEMLDAPIGVLIATGGHPWKHAIAAVAIASYARAYRTRP